jgi:hypothetical protein
LIIGTSVCGKSALLYNLITKEWGIPYYYLYIFSKFLDQDIYVILKKDYEKISAKEDTEIAFFQ